MADKEIVGRYTIPAEKEVISRFSLGPDDEGDDSSIFSGLSQSPLAQKNPLLTKGIETVYDLLPNFRSEQNIADKDRALVQGYMDNNPDKAVEVLKKRGYNATLKDGNIQIDGKPVTDSFWDNFLSLREAGTELVENLPTIASSAKVGILGAPVLGTGLAALKEGVSSEATGEPFDPLKNQSEELLYAGFGGLLDDAGNIVKYANKYMAEIPGVGKAYDYVTDKAGDAYRGAKGYISDTKQKLSGLPALNTLKESASNVVKYGKNRIEEMARGFNDVLRKSESFLRESGAPPEAFRRFNTRSVAEDAKWLMEESPIFAEYVTNKGTQKVRALNAIELHDKLGKEIRDYYKKDPEQIPLSTIIDSEGFSKLREQAYKDAVNSPDGELLPMLTDYVAKMNRLVEYKKILEENPQLIQRAMDNGISPEEMIIKSGLFKPDVIEKSAEQIFKEAERVFQKNPGMYQQMVQSGGNPIQFLVDNGALSLTKQPTLDDMIENVSKASLSKNEIWAMKQAAEDMGDYGLKNNQLNANVMMHRGVAGTLRNALEETAPEDMKMTIKTFHHLYPIAKMLDDTRAAKAARGLSIRSDYFISSIAGNAYWLAGMADKYSKRPETMGALRGTMEFGKQMGKDLKDALPGMPNVGGIGTPMPGVNMGQAYRAGRYGLMQEGATPLGSEPGRVAPDPLADAIAGAMQVAPQPKLPRDFDSISASPELSEMVMSSVSPDTANIIRSAVGSNDPVKKRVAMMMAMQEAPDMFESGVYGLQSAVKEHNNYIITDPREVELYKAQMKNLRNQGIIDRNFYAEQLSALNDTEDRRVLPRPDIAGPKSEPEAQVKEGLLQKFSKTTERITTTAGDRREYAY